MRTNHGFWTAAALAVGWGLAGPALAEAPADGAATLAAPRVAAARLLQHELTAGGAAALVAVPAGLGLAVLAGTLTSSLYATLVVPPLLVYLPLAPAAVALAAWWMGNRLEPGAARFWPAFLAALGVHLASFAVGALVGLSVRFMAGLVLFSLAEVVLLPATVAGLMHLTRPEPPVPAAAAPPTASVAVQPWVPALAVRF